MIKCIQLWIEGFPGDKNKIAEGVRICEALKSEGMDAICNRDGNVLIQPPKDLPVGHTLSALAEIMANYPIL